MSQLVYDLDTFWGTVWATELKESPDQKYWIFSVRFNSCGSVDISLTHIYISQLSRRFSKEREKINTIKLGME